MSVGRATSASAIERLGRRLLLTTTLSLFGLVYAGAGLSQIASPALNGLRATLEDTTVVYSKDATQRWRWETHWVIRWEPVPDAVAYELIYMTSEGASRKTSRLEQPLFRLEVAKGDNTKAQGMPTRAIQLLTIQSLLAVKIVPRMADGSTSASSPWLQVGRVYP